MPGLRAPSGDLAGAFLSQKKIREGRKNLDRALKETPLTNNLDEDDLAVKKYHGEEHPSTGWGYVLLGDARSETGALVESLTEMYKGLAILSRTLDSQNPRYLTAELAYSRLLDKTGRHSEAALLKANTERQLKMDYSSQCVGCTVSSKTFH
jgi:hypothetical protein